MISVLIIVLLNYVNVWWCFFHTRLNKTGIFYKFIFWTFLPLSVTREIYTENVLKLNLLCIFMLFVGAALAWTILNYNEATVLFVTLVDHSIKAPFPTSRTNVWYICLIPSSSNLLGCAVGYGWLSTFSISQDHMFLVPIKRKNCHSYFMVIVMSA